MGSESYRTICIEGVDQVGKADATSRLLLELANQGVNITFTSFPIYATPTGATIRSFLVNGFSDRKLKEIDSLDVRMAFYVLDRLEFMDLCLSNSKYSNTILVLDRSPFSNAVSIGYWFFLQKDWNEDEVKKCITRAMDLESLMISKLGVDRCIIQLKSEESEWKDIRKGYSDLYEKKDVQEWGSRVYEVYKDIVGPSWHQVISKRDDGWRDRDDIWNDIKKILKETYGDMGDIKQGLRYDIGFKEIVESMYPKAKYDKKLYNIYNTAIKENVKDVMYKSALELGRQVANSCAGIRFSNKEVKEEFKRILAILPNIMKVFEHFLGKGFVNKIEKSLS